jgi:hypothetical protein
MVVGSAPAPAPHKRCARNVSDGAFNVVSPVVFSIFLELFNNSEFPILFPLFLVLATDKTTGSHAMLASVDNPNSICFPGTCATGGERQSRQWLLKHATGFDLNCDGM